MFHPSRHSRNAIAASVLVSLLACGGGGASSGNGGQSAVPTASVSVSISPSAASITAGTTQTLTATVTGSANTAVTWSSTGGTVSSTGLFTAPSTPGNVTITATSVADPTKSASATLTIVAAPTAIAVTITPASVSVGVGASQSFSALVSGTTNGAVTWTVTGGSITPAGLFTAPSTPGTVTVTATSVADSTKKASATITVTSVAQPVAVSISPASATLTAGATQAFSAVVTGTAYTAVTWTTTGGSITPAGLYTAPSTAGSATITATSVADSTKKASATVTITGTGSTGLPNTLPATVVTAIQTGNALTGASVDDYLDATLATIEHQRTSSDAVLAKLYNLNPNGTAKADGTSLTALNWDPNHDGALFSATFGVNTEVIVSNQDDKGAAAPAKGLAVAGVTPANSRYLVLASNPFRTASLNNANTVNAQMDQFMVNAIQWLSGKASGTTLKVAIAHLDDSYWFRDESSTRTWLTAKFGTNVSFNVANAYDGANLGKILTDGADLVIVSQQLDAGLDAQLVSDGIKALMEAGKPVLYLQLDGGPNALGSLLYNLFQVQYAGDNYWSNYLTSGLDGSTLVGRLPKNMTDIREMLTHLKTGSYDFALSTAKTGTAAEQAAYLTQFANGAGAVKSMFNAYDGGRINIFQSGGREVPKLLALLGDRIRQEVVFPLKTASSTPKDFLRSYFADHAVYNFRTIVPAQKDLGTFSRSDFSTVVPVTRTINMTSRPNFRGTGAYALPGKTVKITRLDTGAVNTSIFINSLRSGSTHAWEDTSYGGYARPQFLWSASIPVKPGESIYLTSPYGGPIQMSFDQKDIPVQFTFENVSEHPYWNGPEDDAVFAAKLSASTHDWVEVATDGFEMHSKADRFKTGTMADPHWNTPATLAAATQRYTYNYSHIVAGFQGDGIDKDPEVYGWAQSKGLAVATTSTVKHMNADVPTCGWGCSGNPYDAGWAFSVVGHGDIHELGHSLQSGRWQLKHGAYSYPNHSGTNFYPFYVQSRFFDETGAVTGGQHGMDFKTLFQQLQAAYVAGDRTGKVSTIMETYFANALAPGGDSGYANSYPFFFQFMMQARKKGLLQNGWHMMGRIHIVERAFNAALQNEATWEAEKAKFGFDKVAHADAKALTNNDFMAIAMSFASGLDSRDYMAMWGFRISAVADTQIATYSLPAAERSFFIINSADWVKGALTTRVDDFKKVAIDGVSAWSLTPAPALVVDHSAYSCENGGHSMVSKGESPRM